MIIVLLLVNKFTYYFQQNSSGLSRDLVTGKGKSALGSWFMADSC
jgi:hypothetical protein